MIPSMGQAEQVSVGLSVVVARELNARGHTTLTAKATATNIRRSTLDRRLKGQPFKVDELAKIANAIGWSMSELAGAAEAAA